VTTASIEAYRYYAEGVNLHQRGHEREAVPLLDKAVAIDPNFAMAYGKLSVVHNNLVHLTQAQEYARRALDHLDHLSPRERYYIEGLYYSRTSDGVARAIEAYKKGIELFPDHASARHNLANVYDSLERYQDAIPHYEELRRRGMTFPSTHGNLAVVYAKTGDFAKGHQVLQEFLANNPESASGHRQLGDFLAAWGRLDAASAAYDRAEALSPGNPLIALGRFDIALGRERLADADAQVRILQQSSDPFAKWLGRGGAGHLALLHGRPADALKWLDAAAAGEGPNGSALSAMARVFAGRVLMDQGKAGLALASAQRAVDDARGQGPEWDASELIGAAQSRLGRAADAAKTLEEMSRRAAARPSDREKRRVHHLAGLIALDRNDLPSAIQSLKQADAMLSLGGVFGPPPPHVPIWFDMAAASLKAGDIEEAKTRFQRIVDSGAMRTVYPLQFVRSLYFLGQINERQGDAEKARALYRRFVQYWGDGDVDRDRVAEARRKIG
jgi:tetratricopeptide (TPR) repeat protein